MGFFDWWLRVTALFPGEVKQGLNSLITLGAWMLWKHHNCVFNGANPNIQLTILEAHLWCLAGTKGLVYLEVVAIVRFFCNGDKCN